MSFFLCYPLGAVEYLHDCMPKKKAPEISCLMAVLRCEYCLFLNMDHQLVWNVLLVFCMGGSTALYPHICCFRIRDLFPDASRVRSPQRCIRKDIYTSDMVALTAMWRSLDFLVAPNWFLLIDA